MTPRRLFDGALDDIISRIELADMPDRSILEILFAPTGPIQEVSLSRGWGQEFLHLSRRFNAAIERAYGYKRQKNSEAGLRQPRFGSP